MRIAILSTNPNLYSTQRLVEAGQARGHDVEVIDYLRCVMNIAAFRPQILYQDRELEDVEAVIPRIGASHTFYGMAVVRQFEMMGIYTCAPSQAIARSRDKLRCLQILTRKGVGLPVTGFAHAHQDAGKVIELVGGAPLVIKLLEGTQGIGVVLAETRGAAESVIEAFRGLNANILVQEYIGEARGSDIRALVVGDKVVAAMRRVAADGEFRANLHRGGRAEKVKLTPEERSTARRAAKAMGLQIAGVDLLRSNHGPVVLEINSSPGLEGIEKATGADVADRIYQHIEKQAPTGSKTDRIKG